MKTKFYDKYFIIWMILLCCFLSIKCAQSQIIWEQKESIPSQRYVAINMVIGNNAYIGLGSSSYGGDYVNDIYKFDPQNNKWVRKANFPGEGRYNATAFSIGEKGYICLGFSNSHICQNELWEYDPVADIYIQKANFPGIPRYASFSFVIDDKAYVGAGSYNNGYDYLFDMWCYDPSIDSWTQKSDFPGGPRNSAVSFVIGNKAYVGGGAINTATSMNDFWKYDPTTDTWISIEDFPDNNHTSSVSFVIDNRGYVGTGINIYQNTYQASFFYFDPTLGHWDGPLIPPPGCLGRCGAVGFTINNIGYFGTGLSSGETLSDFWSLSNCSPPIAHFYYEIKDPYVNFFDSSSSVLKYYWDFGDSYYSSVKNPVHAYEQYGKYNVCLSITDSCGTNQFCDTVFFCLAPDTKFAYLNNGHFIEFIDSSFQASSWFWDFDDGFFSDLQSPIHYFNNFGIYYVCLTSSNSCRKQTYCDSLIVNPNKTEDYIAGKIILYPNPTDGIIEISLPIKNLSKKTCKVTDLLGRTNLYFIFDVNELKKSMDIKSLPEGMYIFTMNDVDKPIYRSIILKIK